MPQPVPDRRLPASDGFRNLRNRHPRRHQRLEFLQRESALGRMPGAVNGLEAMLVSPVANRRFVQIKTPADLGQREPLAKQLLERRPIHAPMLLIAWDEMAEHVFAR